jgi:hypothetical protein
MIGSLLKYDCEKRELFRPTAPPYKQFDQQVGLCISHGPSARGEAHVRVEWLKPSETRTYMSDFSLDSFIVVGGVHGKE